MVRQEGLEPADSGIRSSVLYPSELLAHVRETVWRYYVDNRLFISLHLLLLLLSVTYCHLDSTEHYLVYLI